MKKLTNNKLKKLKTKFISKILVPTLITTSIFSTFPAPIVAETVEMNKNETVKTSESDGLKIIEDAFLQETQKLSKDVPTVVNKVSELSMKILNEKDEKTKEVLLKSFMYYITLRRLKIPEERYKEFYEKSINDFLENYDAIKSLAEKVSKKELIVQRNFELLFAISDFDLSLLNLVKDKELTDKTVKETKQDEKIKYWMGRIHFKEKNGKQFELVLNVENDKASLIVRDLKNNQLKIIGSKGLFIISQSTLSTHSRLNIKIEWVGRNGEKNIVFTKTNLSFSKVLNSLVFITDGKKDDIIILKWYLYYGVRPARVSAYLDGEVNPLDIYSGDKETEALKTFIKVSKRVSLPPWYIAAVIFQEGFAENFPRAAKHGYISSFYDIGAEAFISEIKELKEKGYLRKDYDTKDDYIPSVRIVNEAKDEFVSAVFIDIPRAIEAVGALLANRRDKFLEFMKTEYGLDKDNLTEDEILAGTYIFYNVRNPKKFLRWLINKYGIEGLDCPYHGYQIDTKRPPIRYGTINCARVMGISKTLNEKWDELVTQQN